MNSETCSTVANSARLQAIILGARTRSNGQPLHRPLTIFNTFLLRKVATRFGSGLKTRLTSKNGFIKIGSAQN